MAKKYAVVSLRSSNVICTGYSEVIEAETAYKIGITSYILKSVIIVELATKM